MKRARYDISVTDLFGWNSPVESYMDNPPKWEGKKLIRSLQNVKPLSLLMPLMVMRTIGFLRRADGKAMPPPFDTARLPNFFPFLDRLTLESYPWIKSLQAKWKETSEQVARTNMLCLSLIVTQLDFKYVKILFDGYNHLLEAMDIESLVAKLEEWNAKKDALFRSRFQSVSMKEMQTLLRLFSTTVVPFTTVPQFIAWLQRKEGGKKVFPGMGKFHPMVFARELVMYGYFPKVGSLNELGDGQGSHKLLLELAQNNTTIALNEMRDGFRTMAKEAWAIHLSLHPEDAMYGAAITTLFDRTPTDFELENMCCEGRKMLKALMDAVGKSEKRTVIKQFKSAMEAPPPMNMTRDPRSCWNSSQEQGVFAKKRRGKVTK